MTERVLAFARAAESLTGTPFRLHGRDPATGLDCIGLVDAALRAIGERPVPPEGYRLRNSKILDWLTCAHSSGFQDCDGPLAPGDLLLVEPGPLQQHLLIALEGERFVHAHAGLGRVAITPAPLVWPLEQSWRLCSAD